MNKETILKKAIKQAKANGWKTNWIEVNVSSAFLVIFDHDFAKAFFPKENIYYVLICEKCKCDYNYFGETSPKYCSKCGTKLKKIEDYTELAWKSCLQEMVVKKEPLNYIKNFLK